jgi:hypothetical protein
MKGDSLVFRSCVIAIFLLAAAGLPAPAATPHGLGDLMGQVLDVQAAFPEDTQSLASVSVSSSGDLVAYTRRPDEWAPLWELRVASLSTGRVYVDSLLPTEVFPNPGDASLSPDGSRIAFLAPAAIVYPERAGSPWVVGVDGGGLVQLRDDGWDYNELAWSPDGTLLVVRREKREQVEGCPGGRVTEEELALVSATTGEIVLAMHPLLDGPRFSPDGRWLLGTDISDGTLVALELATGKLQQVWDPRPLAPPGDAAWQLGSFAWGPDSARVLFCAAHRVPDIPGGPLYNEVWEGSVVASGASKIADGTLVAASVDGRKLLLDNRTPYEAQARQAAKQPALQPGDLQLMIVTGIAAGG